MIVMRKRSKTWKSLVFTGCVVAAVFLIHAACDTSEEGEPKPVKESTNFVPTKGRKYVYKVESEGASAQATRWIESEFDSLGIKVSEMLTEISAFGQLILLNDNIFSINGKTYTEIKLPDAWYQTVDMLDAMPQIEVINTEIVGYPAFLTMDNVIRDGSRLEVSGPIQQEQRIEYTDYDNPGSMLQTLLTHAGTATVETLELPAGSFVCNKFTYQITKTITITVGDDTDTMNGVENITLWVAHGIGMVKMVSNEESAVLMPSVTGGLRLVKTNSSSSTTLHNIQ